MEVVARLELVEFAAEKEDKDEVFWAKGADPEFTKRLLAGLDGLAEVSKGMEVKMDIKEIVGTSMIQRKQVGFGDRSNSSSARLILRD